MSINRVVLTGYTVRDAELRQTAGGCAILNFCVAVNDRVKNQSSGQWEDYPNFISCTLFGKRAESLSQYMPKGTRVAVSGKLHYSSWEDKSGSKKSKVDVTADDVELLSPRKSETPTQEPIDVQVEQDNLPF